MTGKKRDCFRGNLRQCWYGLWSPVGFVIVVGGAELDGGWKIVVNDREPLAMDAYIYVYMSVCCLIE